MRFQLREMTILALLPAFFTEIRIDLLSLLIMKLICFKNTVVISCS